MTIFRVDGWNGAFSQVVLADIDDLPENYSTDPIKYQRFIKDYGTHYFTHGIFGGELKVEYSIDKDLLKTMNNKEISSHVEADFMWFLKVKGGVDINNQQSDESFLSNSRNESSFIRRKGELTESR